MEKEFSSFVREAYVMGMTVSELYDVLDTCPCFGGSSRRFGIDDYDYLDSEDTDYEIHIIIKGRYRNENHRK